MKFSYHYKTSDGVRHDGVYSAASRSAVYDELKAKGLKPFGVEPVPGVLNHMLGLGKRWLAIFVLVIVVVVASFGLLRTRTARTLASAFDSTTRRQPIGDVAVIEKGIRTGWSEVFPEEGERFLASFAIPGVPAGLRATTEDEVLAALNRSVLPSSGDSIEARQIKAMVEGMKAELREYLNEGGSVRLYGQRLVLRQEAELAYYNRAKAEIERAERNGGPERAVEELRDRRNSELRRMGIKLILQGD